MKVVTYEGKPEEILQVLKAEKVVRVIKEEVTQSKAKIAVRKKKKAVPTKNACKRWPKSELEAAYDKHCQGFSDEAIAKELGRSTSAVHTKLWELKQKK